MLVKFFTGEEIQLKSTYIPAKHKFDGIQLERKSSLANEVSHCKI